MLQFLSKFLKEQSDATFPKEAIKAVCQRHELDGAFSTGEESNHSPVIVESLAMNASAIPAEFTNADMLPGSSTLPRMSQLEWAAEQRADPVISRIMDILTTGKHLSYRVRQKENKVQLMLRVQDQLVIDNMVLYRKRMNSGEPFFQLVLPSKYRETALECLHDSVGHMGFERTIDLDCTRFYWPKISTDVDISCEPVRDVFVAKQKLRGQPVL